MHAVHFGANSSLESEAGSGGAAAGQGAVLVVNGAGFNPRRRYVCHVMYAVQAGWRCACGVTNANDSQEL
jgi:hypothetical protein